MRWKIWPTAMGRISLPGTIIESNRVAHRISWQDSVLRLGHILVDSYPVENEMTLQTRSRYAMNQ